MTETGIALGVIMCLLLAWALCRLLFFLARLFLRIAVGLVSAILILLAAALLLLAITGEALFLGSAIPSKKLLCPLSIPPPRRIRPHPLFDRALQHLAISDFHDQLYSRQQANIFMS